MTVRRSIANYPALTGSWGRPDNQPPTRQAVALGVSLPRAGHSAIVTDDVADQRLPVLHGILMGPMSRDMKASPQRAGIRDAYYSLRRGPALRERTARLTGLRLATDVGKIDECPFQPSTKRPQI
jgi:hypothetical protein